MSTPTPLLLGVDHLENADNLGMLLRSAEAFDVQGVLLGNQTVDPFGRKVVRGSRGAVFRLPLVVRKEKSEMQHALETAKQKNIQVIATSANSSQVYTELDLSLPSLILIGNEHTGIDPTLIAQADHCVSIPMMGKINSLNVSVAGSLLLFEARRQRTYCSI